MSVTEPDATQSLDALLPAAMARKAADIGAKKVGMPAQDTFVLAVLAGAFIALGATFATTVTAGAAGQMPFGVTRLLAGIVFSLGLILVVVAGAELFTGNNLIVMAWAERRVPLARLLRNWAIVYAGNLVGALATVGIPLRGSSVRVRGGIRRSKRAHDRADQVLPRSGSGRGARSDVATRWSAWPCGSATAHAA